MRWRIKFSRSAEKFIDRNQISHEEVLNLLEERFGILAESR